MKLSTILRDGAPRPALVITNEALRCQWCLDLCAANGLLQSTGKEWGVGPLPSSLLKIIQGGSPALDNLKRLQDVLLRSLAAGNQDLFGDSLVAAPFVRWLPPLPDCPLFITFHDNGVSLWRDRKIPVADRAMITRVPMCRLHPITSVLGHLEPMIFPRGHPVQYGNELTVVIAPGGKDVSYKDARKQVWGITNANDATRSSVWPLHFGRPYEQLERHEQEARARLGRASDAASAYGPWITTSDEVPNVHDVLLYSFGPDGGYSRGHSSAYSVGPANAIAYFSRFMTLPPGAMFQFGAAGVDGVGHFKETEPVHGQTCDMEMEHVGMLHNPLWAEEKSPLKREPGEGFYGLISRLRGVDLAKHFCPDEQPFPQGTRSIWTMMYNDKVTAQQPEFGPDKQRHYEICPASTLSTGQAVTLPVHAGLIEVSCELAAVIGRRPAARLAAEDVAGYLEGVTIMVGLRDHGLTDELPLATGREAMFARLMGRWADGFNAVSPALTPLAGMTDVADREMRVSIAGGDEVVTRTSDYLVDLAQTIAFISREITLLPGDVISLGAAGKVLHVAADRRLPEGSRISASIQGVGEFSVPLIDRRGPHPPLREVA